MILPLPKLHPRPHRVADLNRSVNEMIHRGSCLCGGIRYEIHGSLDAVVNCHCSDCRKAHAAAFRTRAAVKTKDFHWVAGKDLLKYYEAKPGEFRTFCRVCGSSMVPYTRNDLKNSVSLWEPWTPILASSRNAMSLFRTRLLGTRLQMIFPDSMGTGLNEQDRTSRFYEAFTRKLCLRRCAL